MDALNISSIANLAAEQHGLTGKTQQSASKADSQTGQGAKAEPDKAPSPVTEPPRPAIDTSAEPHGLNRNTAWALIDDVTAQIQESHPWKLAEIQAVTGQTLIPAAYV